MSDDVHQGCDHVGYRKGIWHGPASLEVDYWRGRAVAAEAREGILKQQVEKLLAMMRDYRAWLEMRERNSKMVFWHTPKKGRTT